MSIFTKLFCNSKYSTQDVLVTDSISRSCVNSKDIIDTMLTTAEVAIDKEDYKRAIETYKDILKLEPNATAQYNLGSLYAQGKGIKQDFQEAAYWFHQAELLGDEQAGKLCLKCILDFIHQDFDAKSPEQLYLSMAHFNRKVYTDVYIDLEVCRTLYSVAGNHFNKQEFEKAAKLFRAAGEFGDDGYFQNYLAVLYNAGKGVAQNDLAALYWFDKAVDNGAADVALQDRDGILNAYRTNLSKEEFSAMMLRLAEWCRTGNADVPKDAKKVEYWCQIAEAK